MDRASLAFCVLSLVAAVGVAVLAYPHAALSDEEMAAYVNPAQAENLPDVDLGEFGTVPVSELMTYYLENPPAPATGAVGPVREVRFQGC